MPVLILPSVQVNIRAGELPPPGPMASALKIPLNAVMRSTHFKGVSASNGYHRDAGPAARLPVPDRLRRPVLACWAMSPTAGPVSGPRPCSCCVPRWAIGDSLLFALRKFKQTPDPCIAQVTADVGRNAERTDCACWASRPRCNWAYQWPAGAPEWVLSSFEAYCTVTQSVGQASHQVTVLDVDGSVCTAARPQKCKPELEDHAVDVMGSSGTPCATASCSARTREGGSNCVTCATFRQAAWRAPAWVVGLQRRPRPPGRRAHPRRAMVFTSAGLRMPDSGHQQAVSEARPEHAQGRIRA